MGSAKPTPIAATAPTVVPTLVPYSGLAVASDGKPLSGQTLITFQLFSTEKGGEALLTESQPVEVDGSGHYQAKLGATLPAGLPVDLFASGEGRWLEVQIAGQAPSPRVLLMSVPYAMKAADAATLGGLPASAFALASDTTAAASADTAKASASSTVTTPGGSSGFVPIFTGAATIANSVLYESKTSIGVGTATPAATLDVAGAEDVRGLLTLENAGTATATAGASSQPLALVASGYNSTTKAAVAQQFELKAEPAGNNTAGPLGTLNLLYGSGTTAPAETGLSISSKGKITFAPGQTFPGTGTGTITGVTTTSPLTGSGTSGAVALGLNVSALETTLNGKYAQLSGANFTGTVQATAANNGVIGISVNNNGVVGSSSGGSGVVGSSSGGSGVVGLSSGGYGVLGESESGIAVRALSTTNYGLIAGTDSGPAGAFGQVGTLSQTASARPGFKAGVWGDSSGSIGVIGTSDSSYGGFFVTNSDGAAVYAESDSGFGVAVQAFSSATGGIGTGVYGQLTRGSQIGFAHSQAAAIWADSGAAAIEGSTALLATADTGGGAVIANDDPNFTTLFAENYNTTRSGGAPVLFAAGSGGFCETTTLGKLTCSGGVSNVAVVSNGTRSVETYSVQSAENWYEDAGSGQLQNGAAHIDLEADFAQTVNTGADYHIFLTPDGDCKGLYISAKSSGGFDVRELGGGKSTVAFEYRIMAKRAGHENERLTDVTEHVKKLEEQRAATNDPARAQERATMITRRPLPGSVLQAVPPTVKPTGGKRE